LPAPLLRRARWRGVGALIAAIAVTAGVAQTHAGRATLERAGLLQRSASYTALSFVHPEGLPDQFESRQVQLDVLFAIANASGTTRNYNWSVFLAKHGHIRRVVSGKVRITPGHKATISRAAVFSCARGRAKITVRLANPPEAIDAWVTCFTRRG
jgi:hypothetical protein